MEFIDSVKHPVVVAARRRIARGGGRLPEAFLVDGENLVRQAVTSGAPVETVFLLARDRGRITGRDHLESLAEEARSAGIPVYRLGRGVFFRLLGLGYETAAEVLAVVRRPRTRSPRDYLGGKAVFLIGERIQDPRNVGVLIRTADGFGLECAVFSADSADPFSRGGVRSSTGSVFRVPVVMAADLMGVLRALKGEGMRLIGTSARAERPCWEADFHRPCAVVVGNESTGLSREVWELCDEVVTIPILGGAHSFNVTVAAGITLYELFRGAGGGGGGDVGRVPGEPASRANARFIPREDHLPTQEDRR